MIGPIGAHVSIAPELSKAVDRAVEIGAQCIQIFSSSPGQWSGPKHDQKSINKFIDRSIACKITPIFIHAKYLINLVSPESGLVQRSMQALIEDLEFAGNIGAKGVIVHLGSHQGRGYESVRTQLVKTVQRILNSSRGKARLIIENAAGQNGKLSSSINELHDTVRYINSSRIGLCLDSCHLFAAGYDLRSKNELGALVDMLSDMNLLSRLDVLHVNDTKDPLGSRRDRHENLGKGSIGLAGLRMFVANPSLSHLPKVIEVPGIDGHGPDKSNLRILHKLAP